MNKKLILAGLIVSSFCLSHFSSCSDDDNEDNPQQQVPTDSTKVSPSDSSKVSPTDSSMVSPTDSSMVSPTDSTVQFTDTVTVSGEIGNYSYVDLGLKSGLKWATYNVGATKVSDYGDYFTWASTEANKLEDDYCLKVNSNPYDAHSRYSWSVYLLKYNSTDSTINTDYSGTLIYTSSVDNLSVLESKDDAASVNWGSSWRMPTKADMDELIEGCTWTWVANYAGSGVSGRIGTSKVNGNTIFLPASGSYNWEGPYYGSPSNDMTYKSYVGEEGHYWTSSTKDSNSKLACNCFFDNGSIKLTSSPRVYGSNNIEAYSVRAVSE